MKLNLKIENNEINSKTLAKKNRCIDLAYMNNRNKSDPKLMMEMISLYLEQTPPLVNAMKKGLLDKDWNSVYAAVHKMIPSFSIVHKGYRSFQRVLPVPYDLQLL